MLARKIDFLKNLEDDHEISMELIDDFKKK